MNRELETLLSLRRVLSEMSDGGGLAGALVNVLGGKGGGLGDVARQTLLGYPAEASLEPLIVDGTPEVSMLALLIVNGAKSDAGLIGRKGEQLSLTLEKWLKAREGRRMEQHVMRMRGLMISAVLGAVMGMLSSLGPIVGGLSFSGPQAAADPTLFRLGGVAMACVSSAMLGLFMSGRGFLVNLAATVAVFALVTVAVSPLTAVGLPTLWGIK